MADTTTAVRATSPVPGIQGQTVAAAGNRLRYVDVGINLTDPIFRGVYHGKRAHDKDREDVIKRAVDAGCVKLMVTGSDLKQSRKAVRLAEEYRICYATVGVHPCSAMTFDSHPSGPHTLLSLIEILAQDSKTAGTATAFGEFGLDYDRLFHAPKETQLKYFEAQLEVAVRVQLPLFLHSRAAHGDFVRLLKKVLGEKLEKIEKGGLVHSFTGTVEEMQELVDLGLHVGINGCSMKTEENLEVVKAIPLDRLQIETDGPWCEMRPSHASSKYTTDAPPLPKAVKKEKWERGLMVKGRNEPVSISHVAHAVAKVKGMAVEEVCDAAWRNSVGMFGLGRLHKKHGDIVRYGPNQLSIKTATGLKSIYGFKANVENSSWYSVFPPAKGAWSVWTCLNKVIHARKRRTLAHAFSDTARRDTGHCVSANVAIFCDQLVLQDACQKGEWGEPKNMSSMANYLTFDILAELCFGKGSFGILTKPDHRHTVELIFHNAWRCMICGTLPIIDKLGLDKILLPNLVRDRRYFMAFSKTQALQRTKQGDDGDGKDFFHYLLHAKDPETGEGFTMPELWAESNLLIIAGSDMPATAIAGVFYYLTHHPRVLHKLEQEVRSTFLHVDEIDNYSSTKLGSCTYSALALTKRCACPRGGLLVDGDCIPAGTVVGSGFYSIHHNPAYFTDPFTYYPERWIAGSSTDVTPERVELARSGFFPFNHGSRACLGKNLAYMEMRTVIARTVFLYDMRLAPGSMLGDVEAGAEDERKGEFVLKDRWQAEEDGPLVRLRQKVIRPSQLGLDVQT